MSPHPHLVIYLLKKPDCFVEFIYQSLDFANYAMIQLNTLSPLYISYKLVVMAINQIQFSSLQSLSHVRLFVTPWITARPPCPSPSPGVHSDSRPSSHWYLPAVSSSVVPFSTCPQSLPASESFPMSQLFASGGQSIGVSASASFLPKNTQDRSPSEWTGWISWQSKLGSIILGKVIS